MNPLETLLELLPEFSGEILPARLIAFLKTLPQNRPINATVSHAGQEWFLSLNLSDLK